MMIHFIQQLWSYLHYVIIDGFDVKNKVADLWKVWRIGELRVRVHRVDEVVVQLGLLWFGWILHALNMSRSEFCLWSKALKAWTRSSRRFLGRKLPGFFHREVKTCGWLDVTKVLETVLSYRSLRVWWCWLTPIVFVWCRRGWIRFDRIWLGCQELCFCCREGEFDKEKQEEERRWLPVLPLIGFEMLGYGSSTRLDAPQKRF